MNVDVIPHAGELVGPAFQGQSDLPRRILVAEDDPDIRRLNIDALLQSGYHVDAAEHGAAAWEMLQLKSYHLMITDNVMPMLTGVDLLKKLRAACMDLPVIMATGTVPADEFVRNPGVLPAAVLIKPYTAGELLGTVRDVLRMDGSARGQIAPPPNRQDKPTVDDWRKLLISLRQKSP